MFACGPEDQAGETEEAEIDPTLVYTHTLHLEGREQYVKIYKTPERIWLEREPGVFDDYSEALETDRQVYRDRFGALARDFHDKLTAADAHERFAVGIVYESPTTREMMLSSGMRDDSEALATARAVDIAPIVETIEAKGFTIHYAAKYLRHITAEGPADQILALAHDQRITAIRHQQPGSAEELSIHPATHHEIVDEYDQPNMTGSYATDIKVGVIEPSLYDHVNDYNCGIRDTHVLRATHVVRSRQSRLRWLWHLRGHGLRKSAHRALCGRPSDAGHKPHRQHQGHRSIRGSEGSHLPAQRVAHLRWNGRYGADL